MGSRGLGLSKKALLGLMGVGSGEAGEGPGTALLRTSHTCGGKGSAAGAAARPLCQRPTPRRLCAPTRSRRSV